MSNRSLTQGEIQLFQQTCPNCQFNKNNTFSSQLQKWKLCKYLKEENMIVDQDTSLRLGCKKFKLPLFK